VQRLRGRLERELRRAVRAEAGHGDHAAHRADLDDRAGAALAHVRERRPGQRDRAEVHRLHHVAEVVGLDLLDRADGAVAGVVDEHVEAAEAVERRGHRGGDLPAVGHVERHGMDAVGRGGDEVGERPGAPRRGDDAVAAGERGLHELAAEAGVAAGDEPDAIGGWGGHAPHGRRVRACLVAPDRLPGHRRSL
jgi:hypothetical protein